MKRSPARTLIFACAFFASLAIASSALAHDSYEHCALALAGKAMLKSYEPCVIIPGTGKLTNPNANPTNYVYTTDALPTESKIKSSISSGSKMDNFYFLDAQGYDRTSIENNCKPEDIVKFINENPNACGRNENTLSNSTQIVFTSIPYVGTPYVEMNGFGDDLDYLGLLFEQSSYHMPMIISSRLQIEGSAPKRVIFSDGRPSWGTSTALGTKNRSGAADASEIALQTSFMDSVVADDFGDHNSLASWNSLDVADGSRPVILDAAKDSNQNKLWATVPVKLTGSGFDILDLTETGTAGLRVDLRGMDIQYYSTNGFDTLASVNGLATFTLKRSIIEVKGDGAEYLISLGPDSNIWLGDVNVYLPEGVKVPPAIAFTDTPSLSSSDKLVESLTKSTGLNYFFHMPAKNSKGEYDYSQVGFPILGVDDAVTCNVGQIVTAGTTCYKLCDGTDLLKIRKQYIAPETVSKGADGMFAFSKTTVTNLCTSNSDGSYTIKSVPHKRDRYIVIKQGGGLFWTALDVVDPNAVESGAVDDSAGSAASFNPSIVNGFKLYSFKGSSYTWNQAKNALDFFVPTDSDGDGDVDYDPPTITIPSCPLGYEGSPATKCTLICTDPAKPNYSGVDKQCHVPCVEGKWWYAKYGQCFTSAEVKAKQEEEAAEEQNNDPDRLGSRDLGGGDGTTSGTGESSVDMSQYEDALADDTGAAKSGGSCSLASGAAASSTYMPSLLAMFSIAMVAMASRRRSMRKS